MAIPQRRGGDQKLKIVGVGKKGTGRAKLNGEGRKGGISR